MKRGFWIRTLRVSGFSTVPAEIIFSPGVNVIYGPSETGKSYVLDCIRYVLGGKTTPRSIPEDVFYSSVTLEIVTHDGSAYVIERNLKSAGDVKVYAGEIAKWHELLPSRAFKKHPTQRGDNISKWLLDRSGFGIARIRTDPKNKTRALVFDDIVNLTLIGDVRMVNDVSPVFSSGVATRRIADESVLRLVVSGVDDSALREVERQKVQRAEWIAKRGIYDSLLADLEQKLGVASGPIFGISGEPNELRETLESIEHEELMRTSSIGTGNAELNMMGIRREKLWLKLRKAKARRAAVDDMLAKFRILIEQYRSDLSRLTFMVEGDHLVTQLGGEYCPHCGSDITGVEHGNMGDASVSLQDAATGEALKVRAQLGDLEKLVAELNVECEELVVTISNDERALLAIENHAKSILEPQINAEKSELAKSIRRRDELKERIDLWRQLDELRRSRDALGAMPRRRSSESQGSTNADNYINVLAQEIGTMLHAWQFGKNNDVTFDEMLDIVVGGRARRNCGRGVRGILHAAYTLSILRRCANAGLPHPGFVVLDSPISGYRVTGVKEGDTSEPVSQDVSDAFFAALSMDKALGQVIVIENDAPPAEISNGIHRLPFVGKDKDGRSGFYPALKSLGS